MLYDYRKDPSTGNTSALDIVNEEHTVELIKEFTGRFGFLLNESPVDRAQIGNYVIAQIYRGNTWVDMSEVALSNTAPSLNQFSINYGDNIGDESTGKNYRVGQLFTSSENQGLQMRVSYKGLGSLIHSNTIKNDIESYASNVLAIYEYTCTRINNAQINGKMLNIFNPLGNSSFLENLQVYQNYSNKLQGGYILGQSNSLAFNTEKRLKLNVFCYNSIITRLSAMGTTSSVNTYINGQLRNNLLHFFNTASSTMYTFPDFCYVTTNNVINETYFSFSINTGDFYMPSGFSCLFVIEEVN